MTRGRLLLVLALGAVACARGEGEPAPAAAVEGPAATHPNVLLVVVDTLRWNHVGSYGARRETSPAIDRLAASGARFDRAYSTAPWTMPAVASMLTGQYPSRHSATSFDRALPEDVDTLAEVLGRNGSATAGVVSHTAIAAKHGFAQGFDVWLESEARGHDHVSTAGVTRQALEQLDRLAPGPAPFFLFVHYFDPHYNYKRHPEVGFAPPRAGRLDGTELMRAIRDMQDSLTPEEIDFVTALYDEEIRHTDGGIGQLLERVDAAGLAPDTLVVLTADHGEEFLDHGRLGHTRTLYDELVRVPLIVRGPGTEAGTVVETPVSLVALMPTILDLAGIGPGDLPLQALSLRPYLSGAAPSRAPAVFSEVDFVPVRTTRTMGPVHKKAVVVGRHKLVREDGSGRLELYDLLDDPGEQSDLAAAQPELTARLATTLEDAVVSAGSAAFAPARVSYDEEEIKALKSLGYVGD
jgi:arylsulfatase A-like enzyme